MYKNKYLNELRMENNYTLTENGAVTYKSTLSGLLDLFSMGAAYRTRSDDECIILFKEAFEEDPVYALKCLFYLRDCRGGQGERRFFRVVIRWLADNETAAMKRNLIHVPEFGRWDDMYAFVGTKLERPMWSILYEQFKLDLTCRTPSLLAKWLKSENTSSKESCELGTRTRFAFGLTPREYRKALSTLRARINVLERLMSAGRWEDIEFDKIPSRAGLIYRNAFAKHDLERSVANRVTYSDFVKDESSKVNAKTLLPYEVVAKACEYTGMTGWFSRQEKNDPTERAAINKYWDNLTDYFKECSLDALCVVDTSGSMWGTEASAPINVAISLGMYAAERAHGPFKGYYVSFSSRPQLIKIQGRDFVDKVKRIWETNLCENTNIEATFDMLLDTAVRSHCRQSDLPKSIVIISDMEFDGQTSRYGDRRTLMENISRKWQHAGYRMPNLVFWNVQSRRNNIPMQVKDGVTLCSGFSPVLFEQIMKGKTGYDLMMDKLNSARYECIR